MSIKSRDSKKKSRRWSYAIICEDKGFHIPVVAFGPLKKAKEISERIKTDYSAVDSLKGKVFEVKAIPHETVSVITQQQFDGLEFELKLITKSLDLVIQDKDNTLSDLDRRELIGKYVVKAKAELLKEYYPDGAGTAIESSIEKELEDDFKMPLGANAIKEALDGDKD
jgi:hypothetical protein